MKLANRIFLFFGALSVISFVQFNAMGASDCAIAPKAGKYCQKPNNKPDCPKGCWCEGQAKYHLEGRVTETRVQEICRNKDATVAELQHLYQAKVFVCGIDYESIPYGEQEPHGFAGTGITGTTVLKSYSDPKAENSSKCKANRAQESSGSGWLYDGNAKKGCPPGCFCSGSNVRVDLDYAKVRDACLHLSSNKINGFDVKAYLKERGVNYCPQGYTYASIGAENINQCKNSDHQNYVAPSGLSEFTKPVNGSGLAVVSSGNGTAYHCDPGQYLSNSTGSQLFNGTGSITSSFNKFGTTCTDCPAGWYCPGDDEKYQCTGKWKYSTGGASVCSTCPVGRKANSTNTGCEPATVNMESTNVVAQRVEASDLVALEATCLNGQLHKVSFLGGVNATGTMNPVYECTGETVHLPNSDFTRAGHQFDKWNCNHNIGAMAAGAEFSMPNADVNCTAQWTVDTDLECTDAGEYWDGDGCITCEAGYYCPGGISGRQQCPDGKTSPVGASAANQCYNITDPDPTPYAVTYSCGNGSGTEPTDSNLYASGASVTLKSKGNCTAPSSTPDFDGWNCGNNIVGHAGDTITMPAANVICTAQWTDGTPQDGDDPETPVSCTDAGKYWNGNVCTWCPAGWYCPGNGQHYKCPFGGASTQNKASCVLNLNETQMEYNKCWLRYWNNAAAYRKCLYGIDLATLPH